MLLVVPWDQDEGGVASVVGNLARSLQQKGHNVIFFHPDDEAAVVTQGKTKWGFDGLKLRLGAPPRVAPRFLRIVLLIALLPRTLYRLSSAIRKHRIQIVNIHYPGEAFSLFAVCRYLLPIRLVVSLHGADIFPGGEKKSRYSFLLRFLMDSADLLITNSKAFQSDFLNVFPKYEKKTIVIHNGVNLPEIRSSEKSEKEVAGRRTDSGPGRYILCIAAHNKKKAIDILIRAMVLLQDIQPPFKLLLAGDGPLRGELEALTVSLAVQDRIDFLGHLGRPEIRTLLRNCEVFVLPSRSEPFGIVVIEALACGKAVVASAVGGIPEIIEHEKSGILVEPDNPKALAEALRRVLANDPLKKTLGENGYSMVLQRFCTEHTGAAYEKALGALLN